MIETLFALIRSTINTFIAKNRAVVVARDNHGTIITGDIKDSEVNINQKSLEQATFLSQASAFNDCMNKVPLIWAVRQCLQMLFHSKGDKEELKFKLIQRKTNFTVVVIDEESKNVKVLYFKNTCEDIDKSDLKNIISSLSKHCNDVYSIQIIVNKRTSEKVRKYIDRATLGNFSTQFFYKSKDAFTGYDLPFLQKLFKNFTIDLSDSHFEICGFSSLSSPDDLRHVNELTKALAVKLQLESSKKELVIIKRHDLEVRFGAEHYGEIFPAPPIFNDALPSKLRDHQEAILHSIMSENKNSIIHASGGVGKTVMARLANTVIPLHSCTIVYDCFGDGLYRSLNSPRHSIDKVLVEIANELAIIGLCEPLIATNKNKEQLMQEFVSCIKSAIHFLRKRNNQAHLYIFIDAADNAVMAAKQKAENTIVSELLNDFIQEGCTIVALCRTERVELLKPRKEVKQFELSSFSESESYLHLKSHFPMATLEHAQEFHRLSGGNPRVQAYAISDFPQSMNEMLGNLGPTLSTVDEQIEVQLGKAIERLKIKNIESEANKIDLICTALASLPPFIPIEVISKLTTFSTSEITSFISDFGRGLMLIDTSIQFRDEPTETWFRKEYSSNSQQAKEFVVNISPLAHTDSYVSECLPYLMLAGENYDDLINLALSEDFLPRDNPIDARSIRTSRLNAALKSALLTKNYLAAAKLAIRTAEEFAGDQRQVDLLKENVALISIIQSPTELQKLAFKGKLSSGWKGSENLYKASLLSINKEYKGESLGYLRATENWLDTYFKSRDSNRNNHYKEELNDKDIAELFMVYFNNFGADKTVEIILRWKPAEAMHSAITLFQKNLSDIANFEAMKGLADASKEFSYISIHFIASLFSMQQSIKKETLESVLIDLFDQNDKEHDEAKQYIPLNKLYLFIECCISAGIEKSVLLPVIDKYINLQPKAWYGKNINDYDGERTNFIQSVTLKQLLNGEPISNAELIPSEFLSENASHTQNQEKEKYQKMLEALIPLQTFLTDLRIKKPVNFLVDYQKISDTSKIWLPPSYEQEKHIHHYIYGLKQKCIFLTDDISQEQQKRLALDIIEHLSYTELKYGLYHTARVKKLSHLAELYETALYKRIKSFNGESPESISSSFIDISIAILPLSKSSSAHYFEKAVEVISKFGNEALVRHMALLSLAEKSAKENCTPELTYRFSRGSEVIYKYMSDHFPLERTIKTIHNMDKPSAFALMARWIDREVTYIGLIEDSLFEHSLNNDSLSAESAWCTQGFIDNTTYADFLVTCLKKCKHEFYRNIIFADAVNQALIKALPISSLLKIQTAGARYTLKSDKLDSTILFLVEQENSKLEQPDFLKNVNSSDLPVDWEYVFNTCNLTNSIEIEAALYRFNNIKNKSYQENFWKQLYDRASPLSAVDILKAILNCDFPSTYTLQTALENTPEKWFSRQGVIEIWNKGFDIFVQQNVSTVSNPWWPEHSVSRFKIKEDLSKLRVSGIIKALENKSDFDDAEFIFSIACVLAEKLTPSEANQALTYALERLELHVNHDDADGDWADWLLPPDKCMEAYAAYIWSILANPTSKIRWEAVHIVSRLVQLGSQEVIDSMIGMFEKNDIGAFASNKYPFYKFHAQLYFLIAILRGAQSNVSTLLCHKSFFLSQALNSEHALLEYFSSKITSKLLERDPKIYDSEELNSLSAVGVSPYNKVTSNRVNDFVTANIAPIDKDWPELSFFLDFQEYWLNPLARLFNVSVAELKQTARSIVINEWGVKPDERFINDPRSYRHKETYASHGSIPTTQPYDFYLGYHAIFTMASRLLKTIPLVKSENDWENERWEDWLSSYLLSMDNGYFLADLRDPAPLIRRNWLTEKASDTWKWEIQANDFLEGLLLFKEDKTFICVTGIWSDNDGYGNNETYRISSALVSTKNSEALLKALVTCEDSYDYKLPLYSEEQFELDDSEFVLKGWLNEPDEYKRLDETDPHAGELRFPLRQVSIKYKELLELDYCLHQRSYKDSKGNVHGFSETWAVPLRNKRYSESSIREGNRLYMSLDMLQRLCTKTNLSLIFEVSINRKSSTSDRKMSDDIKYSRPYCNLYTLSKDGVITDFQSRSYKLR